MAFAAAAACAARRSRPSSVNGLDREQAYEEQEKFWKELEEQAHYKELRDLVQQYDRDRSGNLDVNELAILIKQYSDSRHWTMEPVFPTEEEVKWIVQAAGKHKKNVIDVSEIEFALDLWHSYVSNRHKVAKIFEKYDTNHSDKLEFDQLKMYLTDLNEGHPPSDAEVRAVMQEVNGAEGVSPVQLTLALTVWYTHAEEMQQSCCVIA